MKNRKWSAEQVLVAVCCCNWKTNDMTCDMKWHDMTWGYIKQIWELQETILYMWYIYILCYIVFSIFWRMNTNEHPLPGYLDVHQATRLLTNDVIWMSWPHHLHTSLKASRSFCMQCQHWLQVSNALCQEPCPVLNKRALQFLCWHKLQSVSNRYSARWLRLHQPALQEVLTRHSSSLFNFPVLDDLPLCFVFKPRAPQVFRIELVCCTFCSKWYCYFPTPWGISTHTTAWCLHNFRLLPSAILCQRHGRAQRAVRREFDRAEQWAARGFTRH